MRDLETARIMFAAAGRDLLALNNMRDPTAFSVEVFGFHAQQVVEKDLKAWLSVKGIQYPKTHNLRLLIVLLEQTGEDAASLWAFAGLTAFAVQFRYDAFDMQAENIDRSALLCQMNDFHARVGKIVEQAKGND